MRVVKGRGLAALLALAPSVAGLVGCDQSSPELDSLELRQADAPDELQAPNGHLAARTWSEAAALDDVPGLPGTQDEIKSRCGNSGLSHTETVMCWFYDNGDFGSFTGVPRHSGESGIRIDYAAFRAPSERAALIIVTGRTETYLKYAELVYDLMVRNADLGYSLYIIDHRGQGFSERMLKGADDHDRGFVDQFDHYVQDLDLFLRNVVKPGDHPKTFALAHSMGGGIMTRYLQQHASDHGLDAVILTSPMHGIQAASGLTGWASIQALRAEVATGNGWRYVPGGGAYIPDDGSDISKNTVTHSPERQRFVNWLYLSEPVVKLGSATARWVVQSYDASTAMRRPANSQAVDVPIRLFQAGEEQIVANCAQDTVCKNLPNCSLEVIAGARHEPIFETDGIRSNYLDRMVGFLESHI